MFGAPKVPELASATEIHVKRSFSWVVFIVMCGVGAVLSWHLSTSLERSKEIQARYDLAVKGSGSGLWMWTISSPEALDPTDTVWYSDKFKEAIDMPGDKFPPTLESLKKQLHPDDVEGVETALRQYLTGKTDKYSAIYRMRFGQTEKYRWFRAVGSCDESHRYMAGNTMDITEELEQAQRAERLVMSAPVAMIMCNEERKVTIFNPEAERLLGYTRAELVGQSIDVIIPPELQEAHTRGFIAAAQKLRELDVDSLLTSAPFRTEAAGKNGERIPIRLSMRGIRSGDKIEFLAVFKADSGAPADEVGSPPVGVTPAPSMNSMSRR